MVKIVQDVHSDEDAMALRDAPDGWTIIPVLGWWYAGRRWAVLSDEFEPLGPFPDATAAVEAVRRRELEGG